MGNFSKNLRFLRKKGKHNQEEIGLLFKKRANTIGNWENRKSEPNLDELMKLGIFFHVSVRDLLEADLEAGDSAMGSSANPTVDSVEKAAGNGGDNDAFWSILRELRLLHEKVDMLISERDFLTLRRNADKSNH